MPLYAVVLRHDAAITHRYLLIFSARLYACAQRGARARADARDAQDEERDTRFRR